MMPAGTNPDSGLLEVTDRFEAIFVGVSRAVIRKETLRTFQVVAVTFQSRLLQTIGHGLALDDSERRIGPNFAAFGQFFDALADLVQHGSLFQTFPGRNQSKRGDAILARLFRGFQDRFRIDKPVLRRASLIKGRLRAEAAIL